MMQIDAVCKLVRERIENVRRRLPIHKALTEIDRRRENDRVEERPYVDSRIELLVDALRSMCGPSRPVSS